MTTTGELRAIVEELELVDVGDAASYIGEETIAMEETSVSTMTMFTFANHMEYVLTEDRPSYQLR
jgi:hypothetical protein